MCRGGGTNLLYLLCLISNTMPQLEQSFLQPSTYLQHRHLLQTTSYNHLLRLHLLISRKRKHKQQQARNPLDGGLRSQKGLRPFNPLQRIGLLLREYEVAVNSIQYIWAIKINLHMQRWCPENSPPENSPAENSPPPPPPPPPGEFPHIFLTILKLQSFRPPHPPPGGGKIFYNSKSRRKLSHSGIQFSFL